jgi:hypothetical protein
LIAYGQDGEIKAQLQPEDLLAADGEVDSFDKAFLTFGIRGWNWCESGRLACFADTQDNVYLWNAVIHKLMGQISLANLDALKQQNPVRKSEKTNYSPFLIFKIVYKEQVIRDTDHEKFKCKRMSTAVVAFT